MHLVFWTLEKDADFTLFHITYGFASAEKVRCPHACFATHMLQNKELLSLKQWHLKIGYRDI